MPCENLILFFEVEIKRVFFRHFFLLIPFLLCAQSLEAQESIQLDSLVRYLERYEADQESLAQAIPTPEISRTSGKVVGERFLYGVDETGGALWITHHNNVAAEQMNVDVLRGDGELPLALTGSGQTAGIWDIGAMRTAHQEFSGRATQVNGSSANDHFTHTAGSIIASGSNSNAKGMAPQGNLRAFDVGNHLSEMANEASSGLTLSNHSYGYVLGWDQGFWNGNSSISSLEDYRFGLYTSDSRNWDLVAAAAPNYLIIKSAGNDRGDSGNGYPSDGPYDIIGPQAVPKNILTVGAVEKGEYLGAQNVTMLSGSSWGPTDDGRIKPDLVAIGENIFSPASGSNSSYTTISGTSMSSALATGVAMLLQEQYEGRNASKISSAALKGLMIHTARECGSSDGPDYSYGWGLLDAGAAAAQILSDDGDDFFIEESSLSNGGDFSKSINVGGGQPLRLTLCWTDPAGEAQSATLDPSNANLVNDLDIRLTGPGGEHLPYVLNPASPASPASTGDNIRDNVEQIYIGSPQAGVYTITVSHKGTLASSQNFALVGSEGDALDQKNYLYWIGGSGDWSDGSNWSLQSGGSPSGVIPTSSFSAIIDSQSGFGSGGTIIANENISCAGLEFKGNHSTIVDLNSNELSISGELRITNAAAFIQGEVSIFNGSSVIGSAPSGYDQLSLTFSGSDKMDMSGFSTLKSIEVAGGDVSVTGENLEVETFTIGSMADEVNLQLGTLLITSVFENNSNVGQFDGTDIIVSSNGVFRSNDITYKKLMFEMHGTIGGDFTVSDLQLSEGGVLSLEADASIEITNDFISTGSESNKITLQGNSGSSIFSNGIGKRFCLDYLIISNVSAGGTAAFFIGTNSNVVNSSGWRLESCEDALWADFSFSNTCQNAKVQFVNESTGNPTSYSWIMDVDNPSESQIEGVADPSYTYSSSGEKEVQLLVTTEMGAVSIIKKTIEISTSSGTIPVISENSAGILAADIVALGYQWYKDGEMLSGANARVYSLTSAGEYQVEIIVDGCSFISDAFTYVTALGVADTQMNIYPNPVNDILYLGATLDVFEVVDISGKVHLKIKNSYSNSIDVSGLKSGLYFVRSSSVIGRFIKK